MSVATPETRQYVAAEDAHIADQPTVRLVSDAGG